MRHASDHVDLAPHRAAVEALLCAVRVRVVGQEAMLRSVAIALLAGGHVLLEGAPGLAKTMAVDAFARSMGLAFSRVSFTPDLLPSDVVGSQAYRPATGDFFIRKGPVFANVVLADEINRAPAKVQSALLEAMQERRVTIADETFALPSPFFVLATQNPLEQEGTYPLPEAQLDRFLLKIVVGYPSPDEELEIMRRASEPVRALPPPPMNAESVIAAQGAVAAGTYVDDRAYAYVRDLVAATRDPAAYRLSSVARMVSYGASPRASAGMVMAAKAHAFLENRSFVSPEDVKAVAMEVLRHRIGLSFEAVGDGVRADDVVKAVLAGVPVA